MLLFKNMEQDVCTIQGLLTYDEEMTGSYDVYITSSMDQSIILSAKKIIAENARKDGKEDALDLREMMDKMKKEMTQMLNELRQIKKSSLSLRSDISHLNVHSHLNSNDTE